MCVFNEFGSLLNNFVLITSHHISCTQSLYDDYETTGKVCNVGIVLILVKKWAMYVHNQLGSLLHIFVLTSVPQATSSQWVYDD